MKLCDKIRYLREVEGNLRGLGRAMTQGELVRAIAEEMGEANGANGSSGTLSQSYLSQIESGARPHLTNTTRLLLAKFFKVHPGYLVDDPDGYQDELVSELRGSATLDEKLDLWLIGGAERFRRDPELRRALLAIARHEDSRRCLLLLESILETPSLGERLLELLRPQEIASASSQAKREARVLSMEAADGTDATGVMAESAKGSRSHGARGSKSLQNSQGSNGSQIKRGGSRR